MNPRSEMALTTHMHKKADAEQMIRHLAFEWMRETDYRQKPDHYPSFGAFKTWLETKHYDHFLNFRSRSDPRYEAEGWFEAEIRDYWRSTRSHGVEL
ncbi:hypothetical protein [Bradyrhizobium sp. CCGE-LA001]|uniref:hypothetical protein n=1 Tax=Bradyrhizobium sp. CCGE-LA001 TaxID=1223566 RepID=UPI0011982757|nr:hypothetical protein [Bradyrhizobium sp. CCGE-LA001]